MLQKSLLFSLTVALAVAVDQGSKAWADQLGWSVQLNTGISFGFLSGISAQLLVMISAGLLLLIGWWGVRHSLTIAALAGLFVGAGFSNLLDRVLFGGVRDWMLVPFFSLRNNLADWIIVLVVIAFLGFEMWQTYLQRKVRHGSS